MNNEQAQPAQLAYRIPKVAELLDVSVPMVYKLIRIGDLEAIKVGSVMRVTRASLLGMVGEVADATE